MAVPWPSRHFNQVRKLVDDMLVSMARGKYADRPEVWQIRPFFIYTPKFRILWLPDDEHASDEGGSPISWRAPDQKAVLVECMAGLYLIPHDRENLKTGGGPVLDRAGNPETYEDLLEAIFRILAEECELTPFECRRSCATAQQLEETIIDPETQKPMREDGGRVVSAS